MIDTISMNISASAKAIETLKKLLSTRLLIDNRTGVIQSQFESGVLDGSWDYKVRINIKSKQWLPSLNFHEVAIEGMNNNKIIRGRQKFVTNKKLVAKHKIWTYSKDKMPLLVDTPEYLQIELSLPKWALGVNFLDSTWDQDREWLNELREWLEGLAQAPLPVVSQWMLNRVDVAWCYKLNCKEEVTDHIKNLKNAEYVRRKCAWWDTGLYFKGSTTTVKLYDKHAEFAIHDRKRLNYCVGKNNTGAIHAMTDGLLRFEVEYHKRFLNFHEIHTVGELFQKTKLIGKHMIIELKKIYGGLEHKKVNSLMDLIALINSQSWKGTGVTPGTIISVLTVWSTQGAKEAKIQFGKNMFFRVRKVANERGLGLVKGLEELEKKEQVKADILYLDDYPRQAGDNRAAYDFLIFKQA